MSFADGGGGEEERPVSRPTDIVSPRRKNWNWGRLVNAVRQVMRENKGPAGAAEIWENEYFQSLPTDADRANAIRVRDLIKTQLQEEKRGGKAIFLVEDSIVEKAVGYVKRLPLLLFLEARSNEAPPSSMMERQTQYFDRVSSFVTNAIPTQLFQRQDISPYARPGFPDTMTHTGSIILTSNQPGELPIEIRAPYNQEPDRNIGVGNKFCVLVNMPNKGG